MTGDVDEQFEKCFGFFWLANDPDDPEIYDDVVGI